MNGFSGKWSSEELQGLKDAWYENNKQFYPQEEDREFEYQDRPDRPAMTIRQIADELGISTGLSHRLLKRAMRKLNDGLCEIGIDGQEVCEGYDVVQTTRCPDGTHRCLLGYFFSEV